MKHIKPFLSFENQIERLRSHGCDVEDASFAQTVLSQVNYYRFSAYFLPFKEKDGGYIEGISFNSVYRIYEFDRKLKAVLFAAIARIEVFLRTQFAHYHAEQYGPLGYLSDSVFREKGHAHVRFMLKINDEIRNNSKVPFVQHHIQNYNGQFPIWVIIELFTFGMLSKFYSDLYTKDQKTLAKNLFDLNPKTLSSWLHCCTDLRNNCAHHDRLYYRIFPSFPAGLHELETNEKQRIFGMTLVLKELYPNKAEWNREVFEPVQSLLVKYQHDVELRHIGFPQNWKNMLMLSGKNE